MTTATSKRKQYTEEFKQEAVALVTEQGYSVSRAARSLGINANMLGRWRREIEAVANGSRLSEAEREELQRLRRENRELRMEKDILKKASVYFAKEMR